MFSQTYMEYYKLHIVLSLVTTMTIPAVTDVLMSTILDFMDSNQMFVS